MHLYRDRGPQFYRAKVKARAAPMRLIKDPLAEMETAAPVPVAAAPAVLAVPLDLLEVAALGEEAALLGLEAGVEAGGEGVGIGADEAPLISCWIVELKVPLIPDRVNLAEKASSGDAGGPGFWSEAEVIRTK